MMTTRVKAGTGWTNDDHGAQNQETCVGEERAVQLYRRDNLILHLVVECTMITFREDDVTDHKMANVYISQDRKKRLRLPTENKSNPSGILK